MVPVSSSAEYAAGIARTRLGSCTEPLRVSTSRPCPLQRSRVRSMRRPPFCARPRISPATSRRVMLPLRARIIAVPVKASMEIPPFSVLIASGVSFGTSRKNDVLQFSSFHVVGPSERTRPPTVVTRMAETISRTRASVSAVAVDPKCAAGYRTGSTRGCSRLHCGRDRYRGWLHMSLPLLAFRRSTRAANRPASRRQTIGSADSGCCLPARGRYTCHNHHRQCHTEHVCFDDRGTIIVAATTKALTTKAQKAEGTRHKAQGTKNSRLVQRNSRWYNDFAPDFPGTRP